MGGGGAMRAAAKVAGIGAITTGIRSTALIENPVNVSVRPAFSGVSSSGLTVDNPVQRPVWEIDEWEFAGSENDEFVVDKNNSGKPRVVFGPVPTIEETKEATSELKDAIQKVYLSSPNSAGNLESAGAFQETKACISHESSVPKSAMQAFRMFNESPAAQTVVASIACDSKVWEAVMQNPALVEFLESENKSTKFESKDEESSNSSVGSTDSKLPKVSNGFMGFIENVKITVVDMVHNLTNVVQSWFAAPEGVKTAETTDGGARNLLAGGSFMGLAMMVIMVVVLKRGA